MQSTEPQPPPACLPNKPVQSLDTAVARISDAEKRSEAEGLEKAAFFLDKWPASSPRAGARHVFAKKLIPRVRCFDCDAAAIQKWIENGRVGEPEWHSTSRLYSSGRGFKCNNPEAGHGQLDPHRALEAIWQAWLDCLGCPYRRSSPRDSDDDADG
ncbi:hypothetical protein BCR44DRAFT_1432746 [Catenaria anguillulae PL171]|uniref:Uncharacterized protein n=1 Tax=Catenaria anguillulae PL171 TaxID=765915 RepID=A0A1Y2HRR4_9FUNG|nr:hypothetical protein BCR44DRAFT_1455468 [Catenaria anguillulae PL171]ORZ36491.1 hypothetical protein BCR44DRAFT_1432746 [Catenaria anguillulae PL171]